MIGTIILCAALCGPILQDPAATPTADPFGVEETVQDLTRNVWGGAAVRMVKPAWWPYWIGVWNDLDSTHDAMVICSTPEAYAAGWRCREGNPLAGGNTDAGRIATTMAVSYGMALLLTWVENFESEKAGEKIRFKWWHELLFTVPVGILRGYIGQRNREIAATIRLDIGGQ